MEEANLRYVERIFLSDGHRHRPLWKSQPSNAFEFYFDYFGRTSIRRLSGNDFKCAGEESGIGIAIDHGKGVGLDLG